MAAQTESVLKFYNNINEKFTPPYIKINLVGLTDRTKELVNHLSEEIKKRYYGLGMAMPEHLEGARILDMGCGSGSAVFVLSKLVGPKGYVVGIDFSDGLIDSAKKESEYHYRKWGYNKANFEFRLGNLDNITSMGFEDGSFDVIVSNAVFDLCPNKEILFRQANQLLKPGGLFLLADVVGEVPQPDELKNKLWHNAEYLYSTYRIFKLPSGARRGPAIVTYKGNLEDHPESLRWDVDLTFKKGQPVPVDAELATILAFTAYSENFTIEDFSGDVTSKRNQNPFQHWRGLLHKGHTLPIVGELE